jgi:Mrp family chromosome partitioning ATPase
MRLRSSVGASSTSPVPLHSSEPRGIRGEEVPLVDAQGLCVEDQERIAHYQARTGASFDAAAVELGIVDPDVLRQALAQYTEAGVLVDPDATGISRAVVAAYDPENPLTIKLRELRSSLLTMLDLDHESLSVVVLAGCGTDDTAGVAANLATLFAQLGKRGMVVDANFFAPTQDTLFNTVLTEGATSLLTGGAAREESIVPTPVPNLDLVPSGPAISGLSEAVERVSLIDQLRALRGDYRFAIVDAGNQPADIVAALARGADGVLLLAERRHTPMGLIRELMERLAANDIPVLGNVLIR